MRTNAIERANAKGAWARCSGELGKTIEAYFEDLVDKDVPERFRDLLDRFDSTTEGPRTAFAPQAEVNRPGASPPRQGCTSSVNQSVGSSWPTPLSLALR